MVLLQSWRFKGVNGKSSPISTLHQLIQKRRPFPEASVKYFETGTKWTEDDKWPKGN